MFLHSQEWMCGFLYKVCYVGAIRIELVCVDTQSM